MESKAKKRGTFIDFIREASMVPHLGQSFSRAKKPEELKAIFEEAGFEIPEDEECEKILEAMKNLVDNLVLKVPGDRNKY